MQATGIPQIGSREYTRQVARAWERLVTSCAIEPSAVRGVVLDSWRRCQALGVDPAQRVAAIPHLAPEQAGGHRRLREAAQATLPPVAAYLAETGSVLIASDALGILLAVEGDRALADRLAGNGAVPGAAWHEQQIGTNAVGTALTLGRMVQIHGHEHFCEAGKPWSCTAAPIQDPLDGAVLGVIDITGPASAALTHAGAFVVAMAGRIQALLAERALEERARLLELFADRKPNDGEAVLLDRAGHVVKAPAGARIDRVPLDVGARVPGIDAESLERDRFPRLPPAIRREWLTRLDDAGVCLGLLLRLPGVPARRGVTAAAAKLAPSLQAIVDASPSLAPLVAEAQLYAATRMPLLLEGETGTGKDLLAAAIHRAGASDGAPFVAVNCAALPRELIASELFGHAEGAFTGARRGGVKGRFEQADGGTIFLDEIGDMPLDVQPYLLRAVEDQTITRLGDPHQRRVDVRVIAATNRTLARDVADGRFRADLFYRLNGLCLSLPPLRERLADLPMLIPALLRQLMPEGARLPAIEAALLARLRGHRWPGNIRELRSVLARMLALSPDGRLDPAVLAVGSAAPPGGGALRSAEKTIILDALSAADGNVTAAARTLGISRATMYRRLGAYHAESRA